MKIKKMGVNPKTWNKDVICPYCHTELEITVKDISIRTKPKRNFWGDKTFLTYYKVKCQNCKSKFNLDEEKLPGTIIDYLYDHRDPWNFLEDFLECYFS